MPDNLSVLILEDNPCDAELIVHELQGTWPDLRWKIVETEKDYLASLNDKIDLILADYSLPQFDALQALTLLHNKGFNTPFIIVTGAISDEGAAECLKRGASDYLLKDRLARLSPAVRRAVEKKNLKDENQRAEEAKKDSEQRLADIIEFLPDATMVVDAQGRVIKWNRAMEKMTGVKADDIIGTGNHEYAIPFYGVIKPLLIDLVLHPDTGIEGHYPLIRKEREELVVEAQVSHFRGETRYIWAKATPIYNSRGELVGAIESLRDITERKKMEEELRESSEKLQRAIERTIQAMATTVEIRDPYTAGHEKRVTILACAIASELGLSERQIQCTKMSGMIHDVGKIYVPAEILSKPTKLKDLEFSMIKTHTETGYEILKDIDFPWPVADVVFQHHERINGTGYPFGLKDGDILIEAKIIAVADVVEAMASHRPYRPALGIEKALDEISSHRGTLYDAEAVDACLKLFHTRSFHF